MMIRTLGLAFATVAAVYSPVWAQDRVEEVEVAVANATVRGSLLIPSGGAQVAAVIIAGSGPTDRNGNSPLLSGPNNSLRLLAEGLAKAGIASLRYDKRGVGGSTAAGSEAELRFTTLSDDAAALIRRLQQDKRFSKVIVIGHSEGALLGTIAARETRADGLVLLAGAGRPIGDVLREQLKANAPTLVEPAERILEELLAQRMVPEVPPSLQFLFRPSVQPYFMSWLPLDPKQELARVEAPRLVIQGTTDVQASLADARRLAEADRTVQLEIIDGMNHVLKESSGTAQEQLATSYVDPSLPLAAALVPKIAEFVKSRVR